MSRTPAQIRQHGNRLASSKSLYLRQHAHNPVDWHPWDDEALALARGEDRPVFLSVGYSSCHWCHVMEREVFEQDEVAALLNEHFVCIKVDREERPDIDAVYMEALQAISGGGGWPMSLFLTPTLAPFHGETYMPRERFVAVARQLLEIYGRNRAQVEAQSALLRRRVSGAPELSPSTPVERSLLHNAARQAANYFDPELGGFRGAMKFPTPPRWTFLLRYHRRSGDEQAGKMVRRTLDAMAGGGIHDQLAGGFHRYTVDPDWTVPHFEKMLYDNTQLASLFLEAAAAFGEPAYREVARRTLDFLLGEMQDPAGGLYASFDADSGGEEGTFYVWTPAELAEVAGEQDGALLAEVLGASAGGNFEGSNVLTRRADLDEVSRRSGRSVEELDRLVEDHRQALLARRATREPPTLDRKVVTSWNGLGIAALARGFRLLGDERYLEAAEKAADFLWNVHGDGQGGLRRVSNEGEAENEAILGDYAFLMLAQIELFQATGAPVWLRRTWTLLDTVLAKFAHDEAGFFQTPSGHPTPMGRQMEYLDSVRPSAGAAMARVLLLASQLRGDPALRDRAQTAVAAFAPWIRRFGLEMAAWLDDADLLCNETLEVVVAGDPQAADTRALLRVVNELLPHHALVVQVPAEGPDAELAELCPITAAKTAAEGKARAYICTFGSCQAPTDDPGQLRQRLLADLAAEVRNIS